MTLTINQRLSGLARSFLEDFHAETGTDGFAQRWKEVEEEIALTGTYAHTLDELTHGIRMAWRNSNRCIGRLYWKSLVVRDMRHVDTPSAVASSLEDHLSWATNGGRIRPCISVFPPQGPGGRVPIRIWNKQLIRYAGYRSADGSLTGDPAQEGFTRRCLQLGWKGEGGYYDVLPWLISADGGEPQMYPVPENLVLEVMIEHPEYPWLAGLGLRWHAVPFISDMVLEVGGIVYPAAPFNGWYMSTEIGARNLADTNRYNMLPVIAGRMGLNIKDRSVLWRDRALVLLNEAVLFSFGKAGATITDHHTASEQFQKFIRNEELQGRSVTADWQWIVPPMSGPATGVFHQEFDNTIRAPNFFYNHDAWEVAPAKSRCPFHIDQRSEG